MKNRKNKKSLPKVTLTLKEDGKVVRQIRKTGKVKYFIDREAKKWLKNGRSFFIRATYGYEVDTFGKRVLFQNTGTYETVEDLKWAFQAFVKEYTT